jgi:hypothetical protein
VPEPPRHPCSGGSSLYRQNTALDFWKRLDKSSNGCWPWTGANSGIPGNSYGVVRMAGRRWSTHRLAWTLSYGEIPGGLWVLHRCDNGMCCRPSHLFLGTGLDNVADRTAKGRTACGEKRAKKLTVVKVREIRLRRRNGEIARVLAEEFGVSRSTVQQIHEGRLWRSA